MSDPTFRGMLSMVRSQSRRAFSHGIIDRARSARLMGVLDAVNTR